MERINEKEEDDDWNTFDQKHDFVKTIQKLDDALKLEIKQQCHKENSTQKKKITTNSRWQSGFTDEIKNPADSSSTLQRFGKLKLLAGMMLEEISRDYTKIPYSPDPNNDFFSHLTGFLFPFAQIVPLSDDNTNENFQKKLKLEKENFFEDSSSIHSIPLDVLRYIFSFLLLPSNFNPLTWEGILLTCKRWHNIAIDLLGKWNQYLLNFNEEYYDEKISLDTWDANIERKRREEEFLTRRRQSLDSIFGEHFILDFLEEKRREKEDTDQKNKIASVKMFDVLSLGNEKDSLSKKDIPINWSWRKDAQKIAYAIVKMPIWMGTGNYTFKIEVINPEISSPVRTPAIELIIGALNGSSLSHLKNPDNFKSPNLYADIQKGSIYLSPIDARSKNESERAIGSCISRNIQWFGGNLNSSSSVFDIEIDTGDLNFWKKQKEYKKKFDPTVLNSLEPKKKKGIGSKEENFTAPEINFEKIPLSNYWKMSKEVLKKIGDLNAKCFVLRQPKTSSLNSIFSTIFKNSFPKLSFPTFSATVPLNPSENFFHLICGFVFPPDIEPDLSKIHLLELNHSKSIWK